MRFYRPLPINKARDLNYRKMIVSKTDTSGNILYVNDYFCEVAGYEVDEVLGRPHSILRHPDMPKAIFFLMWQNIQNGLNITAVVKNLAKTGEYYWVTTDFEFQRDREGDIESYIAFRRPANKKVVAAISDLYSRLIDIEKRHGVEASLVYLQGYLDEHHTDYHTFINNLVNPKSMFEKLFQVMKKTFKHSNNDQYHEGYQKAV